MLRRPWNIIQKQVTTENLYLQQKYFPFLTYATEKAKLMK